MEDDEYIRMRDMGNKKNNIYQIQSLKDSKKNGIIMHVGSYETNNGLKDVFLNKFKIGDNMVGILLSILYDKDRLEVFNGCYDIIRLLIQKNNEYPICCLSYNYKISDNLEIESILSDRDSKKELYGIYSINLYYEDECRVLESSEIPLEHDEILEKLIFHVIRLKEEIKI